MWITNGGIADVAVVWAQTDDGIRGFVVPTDTPGFTHAGHPRASCRCARRSPPSSSSTTSACPSDAVLPGVTGLRGPLSCLNEARYGILWGAIGAARDVLRDRARLRARRASQFGRPIAGFQLTQQKLVEHDCVELQQGAAARAAPRPAEGRGPRSRPSTSASASSTTCARRSRSPARRARSSAPTGSRSSTRSSATLNNLESVLTYEGTSEIHTLILGQAMTGESAFT